MSCRTRGLTRLGSDQSDHSRKSARGKKLRLHNQLERQVQIRRPPHASGWNSSHAEDVASRHQIGQVGSSRRRPGVVAGPVRASDGRRVIVKTRSYRQIGVRARQSNPGQTHPDVRRRD